VNKVRVGILGGTGYTAFELIKLLLAHPSVEITAATSRQEGAPRLAEVHRQLTGRIDLTLEDLSAESLIQRCDCVFSCLPHAASARSIHPLLEVGPDSDSERGVEALKGLKVIDLSADYRLRDAATYTQWYGEGHPSLERLGQVPYGLPELFADQIRGSSLVANPGCYPTSAILPLSPLLRGGLLLPEDIVIDAKSGVSGAGRTPKLTTLYPECNESISAYGVGTHRHTPEIDQIVQLASGQAVEVVFTPHLTPMDRGILATIYARPAPDVTIGDLMNELRRAYAPHPFVRIVEHLPATKHVAHTNFCDIAVRFSRGRVILLCALDNLIKGAAGAAVQNFNLLYDFPETTALL
jgi:N-acetyl-gamma-glutamyl-phosphate reductase